MGLMTRRSRTVLQVRENVKASQLRANISYAAAGVCMKYSGVLQVVDLMRVCGRKAHLRPFVGTCSQRRLQIAPTSQRSGSPLGKDSGAVP